MYLYVAYYIPLHSSKTQGPSLYWNVYQVRILLTHFQYIYTDYTPKIVCVLQIKIQEIILTRDLYSGVTQFVRNVKHLETVVRQESGVR